MWRFLWLARLFSGLGVSGFLLVSCGASGAGPTSPGAPEQSEVAESGDDCLPGANCEGQQRARLDCPTGKADCDEDASNGCEVDVSSDPLNCRFCGQACDTNFACIDSVCRHLTPSISLKQKDTGASTPEPGN